MRWTLGVVAVVLATAAGLAALLTRSETARDDLMAGSVGLPADLQRVTLNWETDWSRRTIDVHELVPGVIQSDARDAIPPLDDPAFEPVASAAAWLTPNEIGVMVVLDEARFYPLRILAAHEIINDEFAARPIAVTYCPLCNSAAVFERRVDGRVLRLGVSGLLRNSDLVMWDDATVSLWQQITGEGIVGEYAGSRLEFIPSSLVAWSDFASAHPDGSALSQPVGTRFLYEANRYVGYTAGSGPRGGLVDHEIDPRYPALDRVVGVRIDDRTKAYPFAELAAHPVVNDEVAGVPIVVWWADTGAVDNFDGAEPGAGAVIGTGLAFDRRVGDETLTFAPDDPGSFRDEETGSVWTALGRAVGGPLEGVQLQTVVHQNEFWFAWAAFNPVGEVFVAG